MARGVTPLIAVLCLLITGCETFHVPKGAAASSSRSSSPIGLPTYTPWQPPSPARVASAPRVNEPCAAAQSPKSYPVSPASSRYLVIAHLRGSDQTVIRDVTDIDHPSTVATVPGPAGGWGGDGLGGPAFASASTISYVNYFDNWNRLERVPLAGSAPESVARACGFGIVAFRWSPDGQSLTYLSETDDLGNDANAFQWHLVNGGLDRVIGTAPLWCHCGAGSENNSLAVGFSTNGQLVWLIDYMQRGTSLQVRRLDGSLVGTEIRGDRNSTVQVTMGVWSGSDLFFRDPVGVQRWHDGTITPFLSGVAWLHPWASPAGGQIVYAARGSDGFAHVNVVDTASGRVRQLSSQPRMWPIFLTPRYIWSRGERPCGPSDAICIKTTFSDKTYIYDLQTGTEWESVITAVADVWPHGG